MNFTSEVGGLLEPEHLNYKMSTQTIDLSIEGKCPGTRSMNVINAEARTAQYCINDTMGCRMYIIPRDFADYVVGYIEDKFIESHIKISADSGDKLLVSIEKLKAIEHGFTFGSVSKIKIQIPAINYARTYRGASGSALGNHAAAYAVHLSVVGLINDPVFQKYVTCNDELVARVETQNNALTKDSPPKTAALAPAVVDQNFSDSQKIPQKNYRLAIFPLNIYGSTGLSKYVGDLEYQGGEAIASVASDDKNLALKYCYREFKGVTEDVALLEDVLKNETINVWKKRSVFSLKEPDWEEIRKIGQEIDADLIAMIGGDISAFSFKFYLYNPANNKIYSKEVDAHYSNFGHVAEKTVRALVKDFYRHQ